MFAKWIAAIKIIMQAIKDLLAAIGTPPAGTAMAPENASALTAARADMAEAESLLAEIEEGCAKAPAGAQAAFGDRLKKLWELLMKIIGGIGPFLG